MVFQALREKYARMWGRQRDWWHWSYVVDYVVSFVIFLVGVIPTRYVEPFDRYRPPNDPMTAYPDVPTETISTTILFVLAFLIPIGVFALWQIRHRSLHDFHHASLGVIEAWAITIFATEWLKLFTGKYRPYWDADPTRSSRLAFPSGHASTSFATMVFLSLWMSGKMGLFSRLGGHVWQSFIVMIPIISASLVALSRTRDYAHDFVDVLAGSILGASCGAYHYFLKYPPPWSKRAAHPKSRREQHDAWARAEEKRRAKHHAAEVAAHSPGSGIGISESTPPSSNGSLV